MSALGLSRCSAVRCDDGLWVRTRGEFPRVRTNRSYERSSDEGLRNPVPALDLAGRPVVTTVGDLTARHIGKRVKADWQAGTAGAAEDAADEWVLTPSWMAEFFESLDGIPEPFVSELLRISCTVLDEDGGER